MTPRSLRRAAERKANKLARKAAVHPSTTPEALETEALETEAPETLQLSEPEVSAAQLNANRANAQLSTGPRSETGKAKASLNAVKTGLTGHTVVLATDDAAAYERHLHAYSKEFRPVGWQETELLQSIADTAWRLNRIPGLEMGFYALGCVEFASLFDKYPPELRPSLIDLQTYLVYEKQLRNLQLQEARLVRRREKELAEFRSLQQERLQKQKQDLAAAAKLYLAAKNESKPFEPAEFGFEFSTAEIQRYLAALPAPKEAAARTAAAA